MTETIPERMERLLGQYRPIREDEEEVELPASVAAILQHDDFREAIQKRREEQAAAEQLRQEQHEAFELIEELAQALDLPHSEIMRELSYTPEQRAAFRADAEKAVKGDTRTHAEQRIDALEQRANDHERNGALEVAYSLRAEAEAIRLKAADDKQAQTEFEAAVQARYYKPAEGAAEGE